MKKNKIPSKPRIIRACRACGKPIKSRSKACYDCKKLMLDIQEIEKYKYPVSIATLHYVIVKITKNNNKKDIIKWFHDNHFYWHVIPRDIRMKLATKDSKYKRENKIPDTITIDELKQNFSYLFDYFKKNDYLQFKLISIRGTYQQPVSIIKCRSCNQELIQYVRELVVNGRISHRCPSNISSGEKAVEDWLKSQKIKFKTQFDTLKCINPKTKYQLPYDFELVDTKTIIEVQGEQHYKYVSVFHRDDLGFQYQLFKDRYKKKYAIDNGYKFVEINYNELKSKSYIEKLKQLV